MSEQNGRTDQIARNNVSRKMSNNCPEAFCKHNFQHVFRTFLAYLVGASLFGDPVQSSPAKTSVTVAQLFASPPGEGSPNFDNVLTPCTFGSLVIGAKKSSRIPHIKNIKGVPRA